MKAATRKKPRRPATEAGMRELMALPFIMGGISLLIWFSIPTAKDVRERYAPEIAERLAQVNESAQRLPADGRAGPASCIEPPDTAPVRVGRDEARSNTEVLSSQDLVDYRIDSPLRTDLELYTKGQLGFLMYWHLHPPSGGANRMGQDRIDAEILTPLAQRYLLLYGAEELAGDRVRVDAFLFDFASARLLCESSFVEASDLASLQGRLAGEWQDLTGGTFGF